MSSLRWLPGSWISFTKTSHFKSSTSSSARLGRWMSSDTGKGDVGKLVKDAGDGSKPVKKEDEGPLAEVPDVVLKEIPDAKLYWEYSQGTEGCKIYDKKPIRIKCKEGRMFMWCACGYSKNQPFCDGTHRIPNFSITLKPIPWKCQKTGYYWFCQCKQSKKKVFCDGSHLDIKDEENYPTIKY